MQRVQQTHVCAVHELRVVQPPLGDVAHEFDGLEGQRGHRSMDEAADHLVHDHQGDHHLQMSMSCHRVCQASVRCRTLPWLRQQLTTTPCFMRVPETSLAASRLTLL